MLNNTLKMENQPEIEVFYTNPLSYYVYNK